MSKRRIAARIGALPLAVAFGLLAAAPASAHVTVSPTEGAAEEFTVLTFSVPHGCEGAPTNKVAIKIPQPILSVTPTRNPLWDVQTVMAKLPKPVTDTHGNKVTERVSQIVYTTDQPLPDHERDAFELSLQLPDTPGRTLAFPTVQTCTKGETAWTQLPAQGQSPDELDTPAPMLTVGPAAGSEQASTNSPADQVQSRPVAATTEQEPSNMLAMSGLVAGLLGLAAGIAALVLVRRRS